MNCPTCHRVNHAARRYCGGCGSNFEPGCDGCGFTNDREDRFCGGCGAALRSDARRRGSAAASSAAPPAATSTAPAATSTTPAAPPGGTPWDAKELAALFAPAPAAEDRATLPEGGISQDDVDRLFGSAP